MPNMTIASLSSVSRSAYFGLLAIATKPWQLYLAAGLNSLAGLQGILIRCRGIKESASKPSLRSGLAAALPSSELGSVFSLIETISATFPLILAPLASATYTVELEKGLTAKLGWTKDWFNLIDCEHISDFQKLTSVHKSCLFLPS